MKWGVVWADRMRAATALLLYRYGFSSTAIESMAVSGFSDRKEQTTGEERYSKAVELTHAVSIGRF